MNEVLSPELLDDRNRRPMCVFVEGLTTLEQAEAAQCDTRVLAASIATALPRDEWGVAKIPDYDLYIIRLPATRGSWNKYWLQYNYVSKRTRLIIAYQPEQADKLRGAFELLKFPEQPDYSVGLALVTKHGEHLATIQSIIDNATRERDELVARVVEQTNI